MFLYIPELSNLPPILYIFSHFRHSHSKEWKRLIMPGMEMLMWLKIFITLLWLWLKMLILNVAVSSGHDLKCSSLPAGVRTVFMIKPVSQHSLISSSSEYIFYGAHTLVDKSKGQFRTFSIWSTNNHRWKINVTIDLRMGKIGYALLCTLKNIWP